MDYRAQDRHVSEYRYLGDRWTRFDLREAMCVAVRRPDGKCICGRNGTMLVRFATGEVANVLRRRLRRER